MSITTQTALEAADTWKRLAALVPTIELYLEPQRAKSEVRMPPGSKPPISIAASDLLMELDTAASFYVSALVMETHDVKRFPNGLAAQLALIGERFGHFTSGEEKLAIDYCDEAHELMRKVGMLIAAPPPPQWMGPCSECGEGQLWLDKTIRCDECKALVDLETWRAQLLRGVESRLMDREEILFALTMLGHRTRSETLRQWISRERLVPIVKDPERFRFADVLTVAKIDIAA